MTQTTARLEARIPADLHALLKRAAEIEGRSMTDFVMSAVQDAAARTIEQAQILRLSAQAQERFARTLAHPPKANAALTRAFARRRALIKTDE